MIRCFILCVGWFGLLSMPGMVDAGGGAAESLLVNRPTFTGPRPFRFWLAENGIDAQANGGGQDQDEDQDQDGISNLEEYYRGTDPNNPNDPDPRVPLTQATLNAGRVEIIHRRSRISQDVRWRLFATESLSAPDWTLVPSEEVEITTEATLEWEDIILGVAAASVRARFFKLELTETNDAPTAYDFGDWNPAADGVTDDGPKFKDFFSQVKTDGGGQVRIPPGTYLIEVDSTNQAPIPSHVTIDATGAEFRFSETVPSQTIFTWLEDSDVTDFIWKGGKFVGHAFDLNTVPHTLNPWPPNAHVRGVHIRTTSGGQTAHILFDGVTTESMQGTAITVAGKWTPNYLVDTYATNVTLRGCHMNRTGPFLWDYGYLWQRLVWESDYDENHRSLATTYFDPKVFQTVVLATQDTRIEFNNSSNQVRVSASDSLSQRVCFYGEKVDSALIRGVAYFVVASHPDYIEVSRFLLGAPLVLVGDAVNMKMMYDLSRGINRMLHPYPSLAGEAAHGACMVSAAIGVRWLDCLMEKGNGDAMLIHTSRDVLVSGNVIKGARMGAVWIGDRCENVLVQSNYVDGGIGSRILSVERLSKDVVVVDNEFLNGGRGTWINLSQGILLSNNVFHPNTGKNTPDPYVGARSWQNGEFELWDQIYFTGTGDQSSSLIAIVNNVIDSGTNDVNENAIRISGKVPDVLISGNEFLGAARFFRFSQFVENVTFGPNMGILTTNAGNVRFEVAEPLNEVRIPHGLADNSPFLSVVPTLTGNNEASVVAGFSVTDKEIIVALDPMAQPGKTLDLDWTAYLKWK